MKNSLPDVDYYVKLFTPNGDIASACGWTYQIEQMFSGGYCLNFAEALWMTFHVKYKCTIIGHCPIYLGERNPKQVVALNNLAFRHYSCYIESRKRPNYCADYDIYGAWPLDGDKDLQLLKIDTPELKAQFKIDFTTLTDEEFAEKYPLNDKQGYNLAYFLSNTEKQRIRSEWTKNRH